MTNDELMKKVKEQIEANDNFKMIKRNEHLRSLRNGHLCKYCGKEVKLIEEHTYCPDAWDNGELGIYIGCL